MAEYIIQSAYGSEIPPWSALEITAGTAESGRTVYTVTRPTTDNLPAGRVLFSGACAIAAGGYSMGYSAFDKAVFCAGTADGTTGYCGVAADSFELSGTNTGFVCSTRGAGRIPVRPFSSGSISQAAYIESSMRVFSGTSEVVTDLFPLRSALKISGTVSGVRTVGITFWIDTPLAIIALNGATVQCYVRFALRDETEIEVVAPIAQAIIGTYSVSTRVQLYGVAVPLAPAELSGGAEVTGFSFRATNSLPTPIRIEWSDSMLMNFFSFVQNSL